MDLQGSVISTTGPCLFRELGVRRGGTVGSVRGRLDGCTLLGLGTDAADIS